MVEKFLEILFAGSVAFSTYWLILGIGAVMVATEKLVKKSLTYLR